MPTRVSRTAGFALLQRQHQRCATLQPIFYPPGYHQQGMELLELAGFKTRPTDVEGPGWETEDATAEEEEEAVCLGNTGGGLNTGPPTDEELGLAAQGLGRGAAGQEGTKCAQ